MTLRQAAPTFLLLTAAVAHSDTILFRNGSHLEGTFLSGDNRTIRFSSVDKVASYYHSDVDSNRFSQPAPNAAGAASPPPAAQEQPPTGTPAPPLSNDVPLQSAQIPAGTAIVVRLIDSVDSDSDHLGQTYRASLDEPVLVNGNTLIPRGADATVTLIAAQKSGKIEGRTSLTLDLKTITQNGRQYDTTTSGVSEESSSRGGRSAKVIGGTAAVGAIIGAIAGGGKGAAIGAGSGAAAGTAAQVITSGQKVKVPPETRLTFTLQNPIAI